MVKLTLPNISNRDIQSLNPPPYLPIFFFFFSFECHEETIRGVFILILYLFFLGGGHGDQKREVGGLVGCLGSL